MTWAISIPVPELSDRIDLLTIRQTTKAILDPTERAITTHVLEHLSNNGARTFGDAVEAISSAGPDGQRALVDGARLQMRLETTTAIDEQRDLANARRGDLPLPPSLASGLPRDAEGRAAQQCPTCGAVPSDEQGQPVPSKARRWWCPAHVANAAPGDMDPWEGPQLRFGPAGLEVVLPESDINFYKQFDQEREAEDAERQRQRQEDEETIGRAYERWRENEMDDGTLEVAGVKPSQVEQ